jgi:hypothetical protein
LDNIVYRIVKSFIAEFATLTLGRIVAFSWDGLTDSREFSVKSQWVHWKIIIKD